MTHTGAAVGKFRAFRLVPAGTDLARVWRPGRAQGRLRAGTQDAAFRNPPAPLRSRENGVKGRPGGEGGVLMHRARAHTCMHVPSCNVALRALHTRAINSWEGRPRASLSVRA